MKICFRPHVFSNGTSATTSPASGAPLVINTLVYVNFASLLATTGLHAGTNIHTTLSLPDRYIPTAYDESGFCMCISDGVERRGRVVVDTTGNVTVHIGTDDETEFGHTLGNGFMSFFMAYKIYNPL